jgi:hypothetical protein
MRGGRGLDVSDVHIYVPGFLCVDFERMVLCWMLTGGDLLCSLQTPCGRIDV